MEKEKLFDKNSKLYLTARPLYPKHLYEYLKTICKENDFAWDCACGNGQVSIDLIKYFNKVYATDISENQIANSMKHERIDYSIQRAEATNFKDNTFDLICVAQALHWFNHEEFWKEVKRVLKEEGIFAAWGYSWFKVDNDIDLLIKKEIFEEISPYWAKENKILWNNYRDIDFPLRKIEAPTIDMIVQWDLNELFDYMKSWSATRLCIEDKGEDFYNLAYDKVKKLWGNDKVKKEISMDLCFLVGMK